MGTAESQGTDCPGDKWLVLFTNIHQESLLALFQMTNWLLSQPADGFKEFLSQP